MPAKVSFLTAVWGESYISRFTSLALPSFLAPGNLPALANMTDLEIVIMTQSADIPFFQEQPSFITLQYICPVRFIEIDDLVADGVYGVTLTLAYLRPIVQYKEKMLERHFLFMNADFILADGSLRSVANHILAGRSIVLGPSFRATAEEVEPFLYSLIDKNSKILSISPRKLTALSIAHPHPTTVAKIQNQHFCHTAHPNQFFWQVNENTILGRYFLIFMLCLKPERVIQSINSYCDYSFIPELCPSGDEVAMQDSDEFFMLELQQKDQEHTLLRLGKPSDTEIAHSLQFWTTVEHRRASQHNIVFHSGDLPQQLETTISEANAFLSRIQKKLGKPMPHVGHIYWVHGVKAWQSLIRAKGLPISPPELASFTELPDRIESWINLWRNCKSLLIERIRTIYRASPFHHYWLDYFHLKQMIGNLYSTSNARVLFIQDQAGMLDGFAHRCADADLVFLDSLQDTVTKITAPSMAAGERKYTHLIIYLTRKNCIYLQTILDQCNEITVADHDCRVFVHHLYGETEKSNLTGELLWYMKELLGQPPRPVHCTFVGGWAKRLNAIFFLNALGQYAQFGPRSLLWNIPLMIFSLPITFATNLLLRFWQPGTFGIIFCSSVAFVFRHNRSGKRLT